MKLRPFFVAIGLFQAVLSLAQTDSIVTFTDLHFHSAFEKRTFAKLMTKQTDTLDVFLSQHDSVSSKSISNVHQYFFQLISELDSKKVGKKNINSKARIIFAAVKNKYQKTYDREATLLSTFQNGKFNEWTVTPVIAMIFDRFKVPYKMFYSSDQLRLLANPGPEEDLFVAGNPNPVEVQYPQEYRKKYVEFLQRSGIVNDEGIRLKGINDVFEEHRQKEKQLTLTELVGLEYFVQAIKQYKLGAFYNSLISAQKAFYLYPSPASQIALLNGLADQINHLEVKQASDINYLIQYSKVSGIGATKTNAYFTNILSKLLQNPENLPLCDSIFRQIDLRISDRSVLDEITFTYNVMRINQKMLSYQDLFFVDKASCIQPTNKELCDYAEFVIVDFLCKIDDIQQRKDSIASLSNKLKSSRAQETLRVQRLALLLDMAKEAYGNKHHADGEQLLLEFEANCPTPVENKRLIHAIELAYYDIAVAVYWSNKQDYAANTKMIQRGLRYVPESEMLRSGAYEKKVEPVNSNKKKEKVYSF
jgi:hypothetical protein